MEPFDGVYDGATSTIGKRHNGYEGVAQKEEETQLERERRLKREWWVSMIDMANQKMHAAFWVALTIGTIWYTNFFRVIWESPLVHRSYLYMGFACLSFNMLMLFYFAIICEELLKQKDPMDNYPQAVPAMLLAGTATFLLLNVALYPCYGWLAPFIQFIFFMGFLNAGQFLPSGLLGSVMMYAIFFGAFFTSVLIPHEGLAHWKPSIVKDTIPNLLSNSRL